MRASKWPRNSRALSPLFWTHVNPYGRFELDMTSRLDLDLSSSSSVRPPRTPPPKGTRIPRVTRGLRPGRSP
ncbi:hypothetical protein ACFW2E_38590, partial [Streptomyces sp. NPDC058964]